jgi:ribonuclease HI
VGWDENIRGRPNRRRPRRAGRANSDAERRALAKANAQPVHWAAASSRPGVAALTVDGGARGRPPAAAIGYVLEGADGSRLAAHGETIGAASAAVAEYRAVLAGLLCAVEHGIDRVDVRSDSRLLVAHLSGELRPANPTLAALGDEIAELMGRIGTVTVGWSPSAATGAAHALVAEALGAL